MAEEMYIQDLINSSPDSREADRFVEIKVRLHLHGKERQAWQKVLRFMRHTRNTFDGLAEFYSGPIKLVDNGSKQP